MGQNAPGDTGELVGKCDSQHVAVQPFPGGFDPGLKPVALPALGFDQHDPCGLNEQNPQVAIATFGYLTEDSAVSGRDLLWNEPQPGGKVAAFGEHISKCRSRLPLRWR